MAELVITEKPSVARSIADALGVHEKHDGYLQGHGLIISWCLGHLVASAVPEDYDPKYKVWRYEDLPIFPDEWKYNVISQTSKQFAVLKKLMHDPAVTEIVCATDAGREGELIFRLVYEMTGCRLPVRRLWISSLEKESIEKGFSNLKSASEYDNLYKAALCREHADWLVGMNATRLYSMLYGRTLKVGRVMSPTLAMIVKREDNIRSFVPEKFYTVQLESGITVTSERFSNREEAEALCQECNGKNAVITNIDMKSSIIAPPRLFDLTTLQREANKIFGFTAQQTLDYAQSLYEKQMITYPRTDSQFLTRADGSKLDALVASLSSSLPFVAGLNLNPNVMRVINDAKVTDHHAIIPTWKAADLKNMESRLTDSERTLLTLIIVQMLCALGEPCLLETRTVTAICENHTFTLKTKSISKMGWKSVWNTFRGAYGTRGSFEDDDITTFPSSLQNGSILSNVKASVKEGTTTPPKHYTEATILSAMENAGNAEMPADAERKGIGTPATRAGILEKLIAEGLIERKGSGKAKSLIPTEKGSSLIAVLPEQLQSPLLTAEWEQKLKQIENGQLNPENFLTGIKDLISFLIQNAQRDPIADTLFPPAAGKVGKCPNCGAAVLEKETGFFCENRVCSFRLWKKNRLLQSGGKPPTTDMIRTLLSDGKVFAKGLKSKNGKTFSATLILDCAEDGSARIRPVFN
ncbi:MAG: DNA topoisomerase 3 [Clostridia bacterium]|nr:DNA topoisomerase 3 [Clostridia bacterium]